MLPALIGPEWKHRRQRKMINFANNSFLIIVRVLLLIAWAVVVIKIGRKKK